MLTWHHNFFLITVKYEILNIFDGEILNIFDTDLAKNISAENVTDTLLGDEHVNIYVFGATIFKFFLCLLGKYPEKSSPTLHISLS